MAILTVLLLVGCGDDGDEGSAQDRYCDAGQSLEDSIRSLSDLDLVAEGTDGLESAIGAVRDDLTTLRDTATDATADDVESLSESVDELRNTLSDLGDEISAGNVSALRDAIRSVGSAAQAVYDTLTDCP